jgi:hypothetical protein
MIANLFGAWWLRGALVCVLIAGVVGYHHHITSTAYKAGYAARDAKAIKDEALITQQVAAHIADDKKKADEQTKLLADQAKQSNIALQALKVKHEQDISNHVAAALAGVERLRNPDAGTCSTVRSETASASPGIGKRPSAEENGYVMPATSAIIFRIAADSATTVRDYNALLDRFNACRATVNAD